MYGVYGMPVVCIGHRPINRTFIGLWYWHVMASSRDPLISREELTSLGGMVIIECVVLRLRRSGIIASDVTAMMRLSSPS